VHPYDLSDVEKLVHVPRSTIRALVEAGFVSPERGPRNSWLFSFQDLIVLRTAQALSAAHVPRRRITRSIRELRRHLPDSMPLSGLSIGAIADRVVVKEGSRAWQADSGQYLLAFEGDPAGGSFSVLEQDRSDRAQQSPARPRPGVSPFSTTGGGVESDLQAYEREIAAGSASLETYVNLGCLLHETGQLARAECVYREAIRNHGQDPLLLYNLGVLLDDMNRGNEAIEAYEEALRHDPGMADCHFNLALLCEDLGRPRDAIRHMAQYRRLVNSGP
jgi:tetratricopeptide (TPR) repeat protein